MAETTFYPPQIYPVIVAGATWHWETPAFLNTTTGEIFDWSADPSRWHLEADIRSQSGELVAHLASFGTRDGDIEGDANGVLMFDMTAAKTADLPITRPYTNSTDPRVAAWRHRGAHPFDLVVTDTDTDEVWTLASGYVAVQASPTI